MCCIVCADLSRGEPVNSTTGLCTLLPLMLDGANGHKEIRQEVGISLHARRSEEDIGAISALELLEGIGPKGEHMLTAYPI